MHNAAARCRLRISELRSVFNHVQRKKIEEGKKKKLAELYLFRERICGFSRSVEFGSCYTWGGRTSKEQITVTQCSGSLQFFRGAQLGHFAFSTLPKCPRVDVTVPPMGWMALEGALLYSETTTTARTRVWGCASSSRIRCQLEDGGGGVGGPRVGGEGEGEEGEMGHFGGRKKG